jgi:hypothetical protein
MLRDRIDIRRLRRDIADRARDCAQTKRVLRARWLRPMGEEQKRLAGLRREVTALHVLHAWTRGRLHVTAPPRAVRDAGAEWDPQAHAERVAERLAPDYAPAPAGEVRP